MGNRDPRVDAYVAKAADFAKPILKEHVVFGFWKGPLVVAVQKGDNPFRVFGRLTKLADLPSKKTLTGYIKKAMALNDAGVTIKRAPRAPAKPIVVPRDLAAALAKNKKAKAAFDGYPPSHKREYMEWIAEAKREETRTRRLQTAIAQMVEGKPHNWKYMK